MFKDVLRLYGSDWHDGQSAREQKHASLTVVLHDLRHHVTRLGVEQVRARDDSGAAVFRPHAKEVD